MGEPDTTSLEKYREYLNVLARQQVADQLRGKVDVSGVVQVTLLEAYQAGINGRKEPHEIRAFLLRVLANNITDEIRKTKAQKRDACRERSLEMALDQTSLRLEGLIGVGTSTPSRLMRREERILRVAAAVSLLPVHQRMAVELHYLQGWPLTKVANALCRSKPAVAGLLYRGLKNLRHELTNESME